MGNGTCALCAAGRFSFAGAAACEACPAGRAGAAAGGASEAACVVCAAGSYAQPPGAAACVPCAAHSYASAPGAAACTACAAGKALARAGGASPAECADCPLNRASAAGGPCLPCPPGQVTLGVGQATCFARAPACGAGLTPAAPLLGAALTEATCVPLVCPPWMNVSADGAACVGCPPGAYGHARACKACGGGDAAAACPGFLPEPLAAPPPALPRLCSAAACAAASLLLPPFSPRPLAGGASSIAPGAVGAAAGGAALALVAALSAARRWRAHEQRTRSRGLPRRVDGGAEVVAAPAAATAEGAAAAAAPKAAPAGGLYPALLLAALTGLWAWLIAALADANRAEAFTMEPAAGVPVSLPVAAPVGLPPSLAPPLPVGAPLQLRLFGQASLGCGAPLALNYSAAPPLIAGSLAWSPALPWALQPQAGAVAWAAATHAGGPQGVSLLTLTCGGGCALSGASALTFALPFTCQAFYLEALFVDASGAVGAVAADPGATAAQAGGRLLSAVQWALAPMAARVEDAAGGGAASAWGLRVASTHTAATRVDPRLELPGGGVQPAASAVVVTVALPLQPALVRTTLGAQQSPLQLVAALLGLLSLVGLFRGALAGKKGAAAACGARRARAAAAAAAAAALAAAAPAAAPAASAPAAPPPSHRLAPDGAHPPHAQPPPPPPAPAEPAAAEGPPAASLLHPWGAPNPLWVRIRATAGAGGGGRSPRHAGDAPAPPFTRPPGRSPQQRHAEAGGGREQPPAAAPPLPQPQPLPLPPGWTQRTSKTTGRVFYYNKETKEARWSVEGSTPAAAPIV